MRIIAGWKTKFGCLIMAIGGSLYIAAEWCPVLIDRVSIGIIILGAAIAFYGYCNRFNRAFYMLNERGDPNLKRSKLKKPRMREGELEVCRYE